MIERFAIVELTNLRRRAECKERDSGDSGEGSSRVTKVPVSWFPCRIRKGTGGKYRQVVRIMGYRNLRELNLELPGGKLGELDNHSVASEESAERSPQ